MTNRDALLKLATLVRPALSTQSFIPALTHIQFDGRWATTYNDVTAISVASDADIDACVPGELLIKALSGMNSDTVLVQRDEKGDHIRISAGRSKLKLPALPTSVFPLRMPTDKGAVVELDREIIDGIRRCLFSVGADPTHPSQMGVTLEVENGYAVLYSTDNFSISRCQTKSKVRLPADAPIIMPTLFCDQLLALSKAFPDEDVDLLLHSGAIVAVFGKKAKLMSKLVVDLEPLDFSQILSKHLQVDDVKKKLSKLPVAFDSAWNRALLVLAGEADKATMVAGGGRLLLTSKSALGEAEDELEIDGPLPKKDFYVDPTLVVRAAKMCGSIAFYERVMVLASDDATFVHLIAHCSA